MVRECTREMCMHLANLIEDACGIAARIKWTTCEWYYRLERGMKVHGMAVLVGVNVAEWFN